MNTNKLIAYHGEAAVKEEYVHRVRAHREAEDLVKGLYWDGKRGCAVGCTIHGSDHGEYETALGIPWKLARIEDGLFEALPMERAKVWPEEFLQAISPGADLNQVADRFLYWLLVDESDGVIRFAKTDEQKKAIADIGELYRRRLAGETVSDDEWWKARDGVSRLRRALALTGGAAFYAADAAFYAASSAFHVADAALASSSSFHVADAAADAASCHGADAARVKAQIRQADKLLELLRGAPLHG